MTPRDALDLTGLRVLDGGLATELERAGCDLASPLWSGEILRTQPEKVLAVHRSYLEAGADCLLTASYQISAMGFREIGLTVLSRRASRALGNPAESSLSRSRLGANTRKPNSPPAASASHLDRRLHSARMVRRCTTGRSSRPLQHRPRCPRRLPYRAHRRHVRDRRRFSRF